MSDHDYRRGYHHAATHLADGLKEHLQPEVSAKLDTWLDGPLKHWRDHGRDGELPPAIE